jgi:hypothetical protein
MNISSLVSFVCTVLNIRSSLQHHSSFEFRMSIMVLMATLVLQIYKTTLIYFG